MNEKQLDTELLPYPLPPWKHRFRTLSIFCEVDEAALSTQPPPAPRPGRFEERGWLIGVVTRFKFSERPP